MKKVNLEGIMLCPVNVTIQIFIPDEIDPTEPEGEAWLRKHVAHDVGFDVYDYQEPQFTDRNMLIEIEAVDIIDEDI